MNKIFSLVFSIFCLLIFGNFAIAQTTPDPGLMGTHTVIKAEYNLGDLAWKPPSFPDSVEVRGSVHYPSDLSSGPFPVLVFLHGRHDCCYDTTNPSNTNSDWPCTGTYVPITSYEGYDYLANTMASHGYIVISISCNAINAADDTVSDAGMQGRGELLQHHLDLWNTYNTTGAAPFDSMFVGKLNMQNIGTMGHSRGGEGAIFNAIYNQSLGSPYGIKAVITLAPTDFLRHVMHGIPLLNVAPYCDGDVYDIEGVHFYDDSRYTDTTDEAPKHSLALMGANHDFFNTVWTPGSYVAGGADDWLYYFSNSDPHCGAGAATRFDTTKQKAAFNTYAAAFYRTYIGHETQFAPILDVNDIVPPASSLLDSDDVYMSYHAAKVDRRDLNRVDSLIRDTINTLGGRAIETGLVTSEICGGGVVEPDCGVTTYSGQKPHCGNTSTYGLSEMELRWNDSNQYYTNVLPVAYQNLTTFESLLFRASVNFRTSPYNTNLDFTVQLIDSVGDSSNQIITNFSHALFYEQGTQGGDLPKMLFNTINIPLHVFTGVNLAKIAEVRFHFNRSAAGTILISDLSFTNPLCGSSTAQFSNTYGARYHVTFNNTTVANNGDSLGYYWKFGDTASGVRDTSTLQNPTHTYSSHGTFHACLYVTSYRKNGLVCLDSFCTSIVLTNDAVQTLMPAQVTITPNPVKDRVFITGAESTDQFKLMNLYGQEVFSSYITDPAISIPPSLPSGVYYGVVITKTGKVFQKLVVMH